MKNLQSSHEDFWRPKNHLTSKLLKKPFIGEEHEKGV